MQSWQTLCDSSSALPLGSLAPPELRRLSLKLRPQRGIHLLRSGMQGAVALAIARLYNTTVDAIVAYTTGAVQVGVPALQLPDDVDLGNVEVHEPGKRKATHKGIQSRLFIVTDSYGQRRLDGSIDPNCARFIFQPGKAMAAFLLGPGRSTALLSIRALSYNPYKQKWEKRLCRFLAWQW